MKCKKINGFVINMQQCLGTGTFGKVYKCIQDQTNLQYAVKIIPRQTIDSDQYMKTAFLSQIRILQLLKSPNTVRVIDILDSNSNYYIVQQLCDDDLEKYIKRKGLLSEEQAISVLKQICSGFLSLVKQGIVHRDLKPANILLSKGIVKIADFGFAKKNITKGMVNKSDVGTPLYRPVQIMKHEPYTSKCDIWALGFIFYEMLTGKTPWTAQSQYALIKNIENKPLVIVSSLKINTRSFLQGTLQVTQKNRLSWDEVFTHPIFEGKFDHYAEQNKKFENKLKTFMTGLRYQINSNNLDLNLLLTKMGLKGKNVLTFNQFTQFFHYIDSSITKDEVTYFFQKIDQNSDGSISLAQLTTQMSKHHISFDRNNEQLFPVTKTKTIIQVQQYGGNIDAELWQKAKKSFMKLYNILNLKQMTLYKVYLAYNRDRSGKLSIDDFGKMLLRLDSEFSQSEIQELFQFIDLDNSKTIEFDELNKYYCKVNGIPYNLELPADYIQKQRLIK